MDYIYVDNNATTCIDKDVLDVMLPFLSENYGNPSSMHSFGGEVSKDIKQARVQVSDLLGANSSDEIIFTSCGTESNNTAIKSALEVAPNRKHIITSFVEHPAVKNVFEYYEEKGYRLTLVPVDRGGRLDLDFLKKTIDEDTALVSIMYANNETGVVFPVEEIGEIAHSVGALYHCDAVQAVGKINFQVKDMPIDMLSLSGHKLHAPKGVGALYIKNGIPYRPFLIGGHQEAGRRGGTENVASIVALGKASEIAKANMAYENKEVLALRNKLETQLLEKIPDTLINGDTENRLPNTTNISFEYIEGESILLLLDEYGICASSGSACTSGSLEPSHVLRAMGVPYTAAHGSIRFSLSRFNTEEEIDFIIEKLPPIIEKLRKISPYYK